jgi:hypothetical protein
MRFTDSLNYYDLSSARGTQIPPLPCNQSNNRMGFETDYRLYMNNKSQFVHFCRQDDNFHAILIYDPISGYRTYPVPAKYSNTNYLGNVKLTDSGAVLWIQRDPTDANAPTTQFVMLQDRGIILLRDMVQNSSQIDVRYISVNSVLNNGTILAVTANGVGKFLKTVLLIPVSTLVTSSTSTPPITTSAGTPPITPSTSTPPIAPSTATGPQISKVPMFRAYNPNANYHFFTTSRGEYDNAVRSGFLPEDISFYVYPTKSLPTLTALYRLRNPTTGRHRYAASAGERDDLVRDSWIYEKEEGFLFSTSQPGTVELFKLYNNDSGTHLFTVSPAEKDSILSRFPGIWVQHNSVGFVFPNP